MLLVSGFWHGHLDDLPSVSLTPVPQALPLAWTRSAGAPWCPRLPCPPAQLFSVSSVPPTHLFTPLGWVPQIMLPCLSSPPLSAFHNLSLTPAPQSGLMERTRSFCRTRLRGSHPRCYEHLGERIFYGGVVLCVVRCWRHNPTHPHSTTHDRQTFLQPNVSWGTTLPLVKNH